MHVARRQSRRFEGFTERGAAVNAKNKKRETALMSAAHNGSAENTRLLIEYGASLEARDKEGDTALTYAALPRWGGTNVSVRSRLARRWGREASTVRRGKLASDTHASSVGCAATASTALPGRGAASLNRLAPPKNWP